MRGKQSGKNKTSYVNKKLEIKRWNLKISIPALITAVLIIVIIAAVYMRQLNLTVSDNIIQTISELAEHDQTSIRNNIEEIWNDLEYMAGKFEGYHCDSIEEIETQMNLECANSAFSHIYLVGEDGKVYTDKFVVYDPSKEGQNGRVRLLPYFENGESHVVTQFDDRVETAGMNRESILYGIHLEDFEVEGISMIALVGIRDISSIQDSLSINSFTKNGVSRGYSAVISSDGSYIVNIERTVYLNKKENFFERVDNGKSTELTSQEIYNKMEAGEEFSFSHTDEEGVNRIVYCKPFVEEEIPWYFLLTVESTVFSEQNRSFLGMSLAMLINVVLVIIVVLLLLTISQNKVIRANAEARARSTFLANMSHEIRTPLNGIIGMIYLLEKDIDSGQDREIIRQRLYKARNTAEYLLSLINNILDISKLQAGKVEIKNDIISPEIIIDDIWSMQRSNIENRGVEFIVKKEISEPWIKGDELIIKQVLLNILSNAAKFTAAGGKITLSVVQEKEGDNRIATCFICEDTGCGMSEDFLEHIWDSFSQERSNNSESIKGTGLGMAISKLLIDAVGGEIRVKSKQGVGSTFYVTVHSEIAKRGPEYHPEIMDHAGQMMTEEKSATILIAEDNELNAEILSEILESEGFSVILAANGQDAVEKFRESKEGEIGLILMDMQMPVMDGCTASAEIRSMNRPDAEKVLIFACTANNFEEDRKRAQESGMNDFLSKPIDVKELFKKIGNSNITIVRKEL